MAHMAIARRIAQQTGLNLADAEACARLAAGQDIAQVAAETHQDAAEIRRKMRRPEYAIAVSTYLRAQLQTSAAPIAARTLINICEDSTQNASARVAAARAILQAAGHLSPRQASGESTRQLALDRAPAVPLPPAAETHIQEMRRQLDALQRAVDESQPIDVDPID